MRKNVIACLAAAFLGAAPTLVAPQLAWADDGYGNSGDICRQEKADAGKKGTIAGAILGGIFGSAVAGRHNRVAGAVIGGTAGAVAGNAIARHSVRCMSYPGRVGYHRSNCRWVSERRDDGDHEFEICRDRDGVWRPSGRA